MTTRTPATIRKRSTTRTASVTRDAWQEFQAFLRARCERMTQPRRIVLEAALAREDHFRADDLVADLSHRERRVSRGTVYRTLALLVEAGILRQIRDSDTHVHYEAVFGRVPHEHMVCDTCGRFIEFCDPQIAVRLKQACRTQKFQERTHRIIVFGLCENCRKAKP